MHLLTHLEHVWAGTKSPFLIANGSEYYFDDLVKQVEPNLSSIREGEVVALLGDFCPSHIATLLHLIEKRAIIVPLTHETARDHEYFFDAAHVDAVLKDGALKRRPGQASHPLLETLRCQGRAGLVLFSSGSTGKPKSILHDLNQFLERFFTPRPALRSLNFLLFDHIGGLNTLFHTLFNRGVVVVPTARSVEAVLETCERCQVELLPTTPTFLRLLLLSGMLPADFPSSIKIVTYGTERMDQETLDQLCRLLPNVDFRQTYGMSELGIMRVKSEARNSLFMKIGGEGIETRITDSRLQIRSQARMLGYLNAPSPFDEDGWYDTGDVVSEKDGYFRIDGRSRDIINVGGLKFAASEVENAALHFPGVAFARAEGRMNPITGQHVELKVQPCDGGHVDTSALLTFLKTRLPAHMAPKRIRLQDMTISHRFKIL
ncbi:fatty acid--CoA ligase family protein [Desulfovibrio sp. ZJ369]|uniref:class I adenylate-forming enzyme family protein n=1 Tax=Desulfovibrio sp. ZJ369 TaxID=2709793 RepID=UPI0013EA92ED|nr:fatty acid--CoA ligase family protein [Desulfovibrio sp. ZJ369]